MKNFLSPMFALVALMAMNGCTTITIIFTGSDSGPRPMVTGDAGVPMGDGAIAEVDAGTDAGFPEIGLTVTMAALPNSTVAVRNESFVASVGLELTAHEEGDVHVRALPVSGRGDIDTFFDIEHLDDVVNSCSLYDGAIRLGDRVTPDATTGVMLFTGFNLWIRAGSTTALKVLCTTDTVVSRETGDRYALGITSAEGIVVENDDGDRLAAVIGMSLYTNTTATPFNIVTIVPHGWIAFVADNLRQSTVLVAGGDVWQNFAQVRATAILEGADSDVVRVTSGGDAASFTMIAVAAEGAVLGTCILPAGANRSCDVHLSSPFHVERDASRIFQLWGKLANVVSSASVGGATTGVARSGTRVRLGLEAGVTTGDWDVNYAGSINVRTTGVVSGDRLYVAGTSILGNEFVVRRSKPTVTRQTLSTTNIANGTDQDLYRFQASADSAGSVGIAGFRFRMSIAGSGTVSAPRIRRGSSDVTDAVVTFDGPYVIVTFATEQFITGSGSVYTLHALVDGFSIGDTISTSFHRDLAGTIATGYVGPGLTLDTDTASLLTGFLWSDLSEVPHSSAFRSAGGSMDWTNDVYVEDLTQTQTLTR
jgi:hypothetical protein